MEARAHRKTVSRASDHKDQAEDGCIPGNAVPLANDEELAPDELEDDTGVSVMPVGVDMVVDGAWRCGCVEELETDEGLANVAELEAGDEIAVTGGAAVLVGIDGVPEAARLA